MLLFLHCICLTFRLIICFCVHLVRLFVQLFLWTHNQLTRKLMKRSNLCPYIHLFDHSFIHSFIHFYLFHFLPLRFLCSSCFHYLLVNCIDRSICLFKMCADSLLDPKVHVRFDNVNWIPSTFNIFHHRLVLCFYIYKTKDLGARNFFKLRLHF